MNRTRIEQLEAMARQDPSDPLVVYLLALEWRKADPAKARPYFERLLANHPDYLATYYQAGLYFHQQGEPARCYHVLDKGIALAESQGETKTLAELRNLKTNLEFGLDPED